MEEFQENSKSSLNNANAGEIKKIAGLPGQGSEATTKILEKILETPDISEQEKEVIGSKETSKELKAFYFGHEKGRKEGVSEGIAKGVAATVFILAVYRFFKKES